MNWNLLKPYSSEEVLEALENVALDDAYLYDPILSDDGSLIWALKPKYQVMISLVNEVHDYLEEFKEDYNDSKQF